MAGRQGVDNTTFGVNLEVFRKFQALLLAGNLQMQQLTIFSLQAQMKYMAIHL
ncbi:MAG: hypothetical protein ACLR4C_08995 [Eubacterium ventriosum]